jgi:hypothetical protein
VEEETDFKSLRVEAMIVVSIIVSVLRRGIQKYGEISDRNRTRIEWDRTHRIGKIRFASLFYKLGFVFLFLSFFLSFSLSLFVCVCL